MTDVGILGADAVRGNPDALGAVTQFLRTTATEIETVRGTLTSHTLHGSWAGDAAQAFRGLLNDTPNDLAKAARSYDHAADAVASYVARLRSAQATAASLADRLANALARASQGDRAIGLAQQAVDAARRTYNHTPDPAAHRRARLVLDDRLRALSNAQHARGAVQGEIDALRRQAADNRHALDSAARSARDLLHQASVEGIRNANALHRAGSLIVNGVKHDVKRLVHVAGRVLHEAAQVAHAVGHFFASMDWKKISGVLETIGLVMAGVALLAGLVVLAVGTGGALAVGAAFVAAAAVLIGEAIAIAETVVDLGRYFIAPDHGDVTPGDLLVDAVFLIPGLKTGKLLFRGGKTLVREISVMRALHPVGDFIYDARQLERRFNKMVYDELKTGEKAAEEVAKQGYDHWVKPAVDRVLTPDTARDLLKGLLPVPMVAPVYRNPLTQVVHKITIPAVERLVPVPALEAR
jgi:uncharacterized protein YukE